MKKLIAIIAVAGGFLVIISFEHRSVEDPTDSYLRYREEYSHNLKDPHLRRYRKLFCEAPMETSYQEKNEEKQWNYSL